MARSHFSRKLCLAMTGSTIVLTLFVLLFRGSTVVSFAPRSDSKADQSTLQLLHVVFRHGPRTPADTYPNDPHVNQTFFPYGWGHITNSGKRELFNVGAWLRGRYAKFLGPYYHPNLVHAQATGVARTHMTLQTVLASLFPPKDTPMEWNSKYNWQPIPVFSQPLDEDTLLLVRTPCPRYHEALQEVLLSPEVRAEVRPYREMFGELSHLTGLNLTEPEDIQSLYLTLLAEQEYGLELPTWTRDYFPERMQFLAEQSYLYNVYTPEMQRIKAGPFLQKMFNEMKQRTEGILKPDKRKLFIYAGHDSTVVNIMAALKIWKRQMPRYSAMTIFELHKNEATGEHYVEIYFRNSAEGPLEKLEVPGCHFRCPLKKLVELSQDVLPGGPDAKQCDPVDQSFTPPPLRGP